MENLIKDMPGQERPRERLNSLGAQSLSLHELFQVILAQGGYKTSVASISHRIISRFKSLDNLEQAKMQELCSIEGVGYAKASQIKAALELGRRYSMRRPSNSEKKILSSADAYKIGNYYLRGKKKEHLLLFSLDSRGRLIVEPETVSIGVLDCSLVHPREIFNIAIRNSAASIIIMHNHPSGSVDPSDQDFEVTKQIYLAGNIIGIGLVDHIVIGKWSYSSIRELNPEIFAVR